MVPPAPSSAGQEAVELAESAGLILDEWERDALIDSLGERKDGRWAAFEVGIVVPRQNGKGAILEARELAGLYLFGENLILHSAHEFKTSSEAFRRIWTLIQNTPDLERRVLRVATAHGQEGIELRGGQRLRFVARTSGSGRGFTGDTIILDEAFNLPSAAIEALVPTMAARPNAQLWYTSSAPLPGEESEVLRKLCKRGRKGSARLAYMEFCADDSAWQNLDDRQAWVDANPGLGIRITEEFIDELERATLSDEGFARERLGLWRDGDHGAVITAEQWKALEDTDSRRVGAVAFAVDVPPDSSWASIAAVGARADGVPHAELVRHEAGTDWVPAALAALKAKHNPLGVWLDRSGAAGGLVPMIEKAGVKKRPKDAKGVGFLEPVAGGELGQACALLLGQVVDRGFRHIGQPELAAAVDGATKRPLGDGWAWSRKNSLVNIAPLVAVTLALWGFNQLRNERPASGLVDPNDVAGPDQPWDDDWDD